MEELNKIIDKILETKTKEMNNILNLKNKNIKMTDTEKIDTIDYHSKTTLGKISAEQERKYKSSKAFKNQQSYARI